MIYILYIQYLNVIYTVVVDDDDEKIYMIL